MRRCDDADLGDAVDYSSCIRKIADNERTLISREPSMAKLNVEAFFGGSDIMIAKRGQEFFEGCWQSGEVAMAISFGTQTFPETDHDSVLIDQKQGALRTVFKNVAQLISSSEG